ncbi:MAG: glycerol acyltransferase [Marinilabiliales bacterium]|nr:MAG: glycerol acyltransferase [Marinilabiliales bacterium]
MTEEQKVPEPVRIDVDEIFRNKNPRLYKLLPGFILGYIKRTIHQDQINEILETHKDKYGLDFIRVIFERMGIDYDVRGEENIPRSGRNIFVSNHPLGGLDGMIFLDIIGKHHKKVKFIVNDLLLNLRNLEPVFVPVNKHGRQSTEYAKKIEELYRSDYQVLYFPAGICSRKQGRIITDLEWKRNFIKKAIDHKRDIVPVHFEGKNSKFFYRLANIRKKLGIRANIEMFYLPDEMFSQTGHKITVTIGNPIPWERFDKSRSRAEWAGEVRKEVYRLAEG